MTFAIIMIICFVLIKLLPITIDVQIGKDAELLRQQLIARGYYDPIPVQFFNYIRRILVYGDFGIGVQLAEYRNKPVWNVFIEKLPPTVLINIYSSLLAVPIGIALGIFAALKKNKWQDHVVSTGVMVIISVPSFVYAFLIQLIFCYKLSWFPLTMNPGYDYFSASMFRSMFPAVLCLSFGSIAGYARFTRAELTEVLTSEYMLLARTKGLTKRQATVRHALRNAMVPIFPSIVGEFISVMSGSLIIEKIYSIPGVGGLYLDAINMQDYDFFMLLSGFYILIGLLAAIVIDLSYGFIDPRIKMGVK
ncbi:MAG: ABC transporter permease [Anaeroplasmataceae bacterium]|nr:ABC transporter permease [Anaeroplasmataceae bacterium]